MANGITEATTKPALRLPKNITKTKITIKAPSSKLVSTVVMALLTILVLSRKASISTPSGNDFLISSILVFTLFITSLLLAPFNIITTPPATSPWSL